MASYSYFVRLVNNLKGRALCTALLPLAEGNSENDGFVPPLTINQIFQRMKPQLGQSLNYPSEVTSALKEPIDRGVIRAIHTTPLRYELVQPTLVEKLIASNTIRFTDIGSPGYLRILLSFCLGNGIATDALAHLFPGMLIALAGEFTGSEVASATGVARATNHLNTGTKQLIYTAGIKNVGNRNCPSYQLSHDEQVRERLRLFIDLLMAALQ